jgi:hypothetical protein
MVGGGWAGEPATIADGGTAAKPSGTTGDARCTCGELPAPGVAPYQSLLSTPGGFMNTTCKPTLARRSRRAAAQRNRVLRNTYWLLALSMVPTVLGAWIGVQHRHRQRDVAGIGLVVFLVGAFGFMFAIEKTRTRLPACRCCWASPSSWA